MNGTIRYTIRPYDTFWMLAQIFNTTAESIMELNPGVNPNNLQVGHVINIRPGFQYYPPQQGNNNQQNNNNRMDDDRAEVMLPDLTDYFRMLWGQHIMWTVLVMMESVYDLPGVDAFSYRLLRNAADFAEAIRPFYGDEAAQRFENLLRDHIIIASELIQVAQAEDINQVNELWQRWVDNANQIAEFLGSLNPEWSPEDWSAMLMEHLELLWAALTNMLEQNSQALVDSIDALDAQAIEMADMMAEGIAEQFPG